MTGRSEMVEKVTVWRLPGSQEHGWRRFHVEEQELPDGARTACGLFIPQAARPVVERWTADQVHAPDSTVCQRCAGHVPTQNRDRS